MSAAAIDKGMRSDRSWISEYIDSRLDRLNAVQRATFDGVMFGIIGVFGAWMFGHASYASMYLSAFTAWALWALLLGLKPLRRLGPYLGFKPCTPRYFLSASGLFLSLIAVKFGTFATLYYAAPRLWGSQAWNPSAAGVVERVTASPSFNLDLLLLVVLGPVLEECLFRGILFQELARRLGSTKGMVLSATIFGAAHLSPLVFPMHFASGLALAWLFVRSKSIYPSIILHVLNNALAAAMAFAMAT